MTYEMQLTLEMKSSMKSVKRRMLLSPVFLSMVTE